MVIEQPMKNNFTEHSPLVSVIMPVYNGSKTIRTAICSVLDQSFKNFELIVCDDASTDRTHRILKSIQDKRILVIRNKKNLGEGPSRDRAIDKANGIWLAFIDADDMWSNERLEILLNFADKSAESIIFDDILECHDTPNGMIPWHPIRGNDAFGCKRDNGYADIAVTQLINSNRLLIKPLIPLKHVLRNNIRHSKRRFGADIEFFIELFALCIPLRYIPKPMYYYRITPGSMTSLPDRMTLFREVFENAINKFDHDPSVQLALLKKIAKVCRNELYIPFVLALKMKQYWTAIQLIRKYPWIVKEFIYRLPPSLCYHFHRIRYRGKTRGI